MQGGGEVSLIYIVTFKEAVGSNSNDQNKIIYRWNTGKFSLSQLICLCTCMNLQDVDQQMGFVCVCVLFYSGFH